ncbi:sensor histidine kinase [Stackebrandtia nassauensis]|uniref:histidine kinase n=1 Tax=Stackebrandtia nassauensis (strain DSM 44728 / CIP 108903 / NRRL B-16338 / NBRC 102104 / LLR-40K-21) TaxID=446470 RepID=D3Q6W0_STANL|nr:sensor histidine kinase [Stackebrandtia nassauensis]ADD40359.1 histidine kinase [Stackebrandtia nassauensis DSM 44728]
MELSRPPRQPLVDAVVVAVAAALVVVDGALAASDAGRVEPAGAALLASALSLALWRRFPRLVLIGALAAVAVYSQFNTMSMLGSVPLLAAVFNSMRLGHRWFSVTLVAPVIVVLTTINLIEEPDRPLRSLPEASGIPLGWVVAAGVLGEVFRQYRAYVDQAEQRAIEAERGREEMALRRAGEERLRIARELHDSLTHAISVIKMQSSVAVHLAAKQGQRPSEALTAIQQASIEANRELRSTLKVLRDDQPPEPGLHRLSELVEQIRLAGVRATVTVEGERGAVPTEVDWTAFRIVQESLTNVARHAGAETAQVLLRYSPGALEVNVTDDGRADPSMPPVPGVGLTGMNERVAGIGGRLRAGPKPGGGFAVSAVLPLGTVR